jgi:hypothetical protein
MPGGSEELEQSFAAFVRDHGERHLRVAVLLTGDWHAAAPDTRASPGSELRGNTFEQPISPAELLGVLRSAAAVRYVGLASDDLVGVAHGGQPVGDGDRGPALDKVSKAFCTARSVSVSSALVASSKTSTRGSRSRVPAIATRPPGNEAARRRAGRSQPGRRAQPRLCFVDRWPR